MNVFRSSLAVREAWRDMWATPALTALSIGLTTLVFGLMFVSIAGDGQRVVGDYEDAVERGYFAVAVADRSGVAVAAAQCDAMLAISGVEAAGGVIGETTVTVLDGTARVRLIRLTPGAARVAWPEIDPAAPGLIAASGVAERYGWSAGTEVAFSESKRPPDRIGAIATAPSRIVGLDDALVEVVAADGVVSRCLVWPEPVHAPRVTAALTGWLGESTLVAPLSPDAHRAAEIVDRANQLSHHPGWMLASGSAALIIAAIFFIRRRDFALYRNLGASERAITAMFAAEVFVRVVVPLQFTAWVGLLVLAHGPELIVHTAIAAWLRCLAVAVALPMIGYLIAQRRNARRTLSAV